MGFLLASTGEVLCGSVTGATRQVLRFAQGDAETIKANPTHYERLQDLPV
jgi:hypothetical protein